MDISPPYLVTGAMALFPLVLAIGRKRMPLALAFVFAGLIAPPLLRLEPHILSVAMRVIPTLWRMGFEVQFLPSVLIVTAAIGALLPLLDRWVVYPGVLMVRRMSAWARWVGFLGTCTTGALLIWLITRWQFLKDFVLRESLPLSPLPFFAYLALVALLAVWGRFRSAKGGPLGVVSRAWRIKAELRYPLPTVMVAAAGLAFLMIPGLIWLRPFKGQPLLQSDLNSEAARFHPASQLHNAAQADEWWDPGLIVFLRDHTAEDAVIWSGRWPCRFPIYVNRWARQVKWTGIEGIEKLRQRDPTYILFLRPSALPSDMNDLLYLSHAFEADGGLFKRVYESVQVALFRMSPTPQRMVELQLNHILAGNAYFAGEEWDKAVAEYEAALELDPDDPLAHLGLGRAYQAQGEMEKAIAALERAVGASPEDAWPYFYLGQAYASLAEMEKTNAQTYLQEAAEAYWRSLALNWENTAAGEELMKTCEKLGDWCQQAGMFDVMVAHFEEAAELAPRDGELQLALARWYQAAGRYEEAVAAYLRATDLRPGDADVYISLGAVYLAQHRVGDAAAAFERALELEPVQGHMSLARLYQREGWMDKAIAHYLAAADAAVGGRTKAHLLGKAGQIYEARGQLDRAVAHYLAAAQATGDSDTMRALYRRVADMYLAADNPEAARSLIRSVLRIAPRNAGAWSLALDVYPALIEWYEAQGKMTEARAMAWELLAIAPRHKAALQALTYYDFIANFSTADVEAPEESFPHIKITEFTMPATGDQQAVLLMLPEAHVSYRLKVPSEPSVLRFGLAVNPETWGLGGDGSTFEVHLTDERGAARLLFSEHVGNDPEEQKWHDREVSLAPFAGQEVTITFVTRPGPGGDFTGDEAGWATPRVMWAHTEEEDFWDYSEEEISVADTLKTSPQLFTTLHPLD